MWGGRLVRIIAVIKVIEGRIGNVGMLRHSAFESSHLSYLFKTVPRLPLNEAEQRGRSLKGGPNVEQNGSATLQTCVPCLKRHAVQEVITKKLKVIDSLIRCNGALCERTRAKCLDVEMTSGVTTVAIDALHKDGCMRVQVSEDR